jgi:hypothetical protein
MRRQRRWAILTVLVLGCVGPPARDASAQTPAPGDKAFWRAIAANKYAVPTGADVPALVRGLSARLGSPDPEWRDDIAYSVLASWIYRQRVVPAPLLRELSAAWRGNLTRGIGESNTDSVLLRSFSALSLGIVAALDNEAPFLDKAEFDALLDSALVYLRDERDVRGRDPDRGWIHSVAHTADLLKFLARSRHLAAAQQRRILDAITAKLASTRQPLVHGEDERLARAVLSIAARQDFDRAAFEAWTKTLPPPRPAGPPDEGDMAAAQNRRTFGTALYAVLSTDTRGLTSVQAARDLVLAALRTFM